MSKTILANVKGFVPLIDTITKKHGVLVSAVFGRVWRYCQGEGQECTASLSTIGAELGLSYATVLRHVKLLVKDGYLEDITPGLRNHPHSYKDTGKAEIALSILAGETSALSQSEGALSLCKSALSQSASDSITVIDEDKIDLKIDLKIREKDYDLLREAQIITGLLALANDMPTLVKWEQGGVIPDDIRAALAWRAENNKPPVKAISQLSGGVEVSRLQRIQRNGVKPTIINGKGETVIQARD